MTSALQDFDAALAEAIQFDTDLLNAAGVPRIPRPHFLDRRQAFSAIEITVSKDSSGNFNLSDVKAFMKCMDNAGSEG